MTASCMPSLKTAATNDDGHISRHSSLEIGLTDAAVRQQGVPLTGAHEMCTWILMEYCAGCVFLGCGVCVWGGGVLHVFGFQDACVLCIYWTFYLCEYPSYTRTCAHTHTHTHTHTHAHTHTHTHTPI